MAAKAVIRDVGRVLDLPFNFVDGLSKLVPNELGITLSDALEKEPQLQERRENEEEVDELLKLALRLEGLVRNVGMHAGGVLIAPGKISDFSPVYCQEDGSSLVSQYDKDDVEAVGLVKFDFLGLRTLTILDMALENANAQRAEKGEAPLSFESLPIDDKASFQILKKANTTAVFQLESRGMKDMLKQALPDCFEDIIALVSLYRPGPMDLIPDFCRRKKGLQRIEYPHPKAEAILKETYGIIVYQEQVMQIAQVVGGYTLGGADLLRRAMGKKKVEEMDKQRAVFTKGAMQNDINQSEYRFKPLNDKEVLYGLGAIKGTGLAAIELIVASRNEEGPFKDLFDFCARLDLRKVNRRVIESLIRAGAFDKIEPNRAALLEVVATAIAAAEQSHQHAGQDSLFGDVIAADHQLPDVQPWKPEQALIEEKSSTFVKGTLADLKPQDNLKLLAGIVMGVRVRNTQRGKMAIVTVDDAVGRADVVVGAELLNQNADLIKTDQLLIIEGKISHDDFSGGNRVSARRLMDIAGARSHYAQMLTLSCNGTSDAHKLRTILGPYCRQGDEQQRCRVKIAYHNQQAQASVMLGDEWRVSLHDELLQNLNTWLSKENVKILYN